jgi:hypothetical protein
LRAIKDKLRLAQTKLSCHWNNPDVARGYKAAVSLHSHTNCSKESLGFIQEFAQKWPVLRWALERQYKRSRVPVDLTTAYWTPPLTPALAFETERNQIENVLGLTSLVALTDHDCIDAPTFLRTAAEARKIPFSLEWSVPFGDAIFHLGVHNLPSYSVHGIVNELAAYTQEPSSRNLSELIAMLDQFPEVLVIFNHPLWDLRGLGRKRFLPALDQFLDCNARFLHAFELNATRSWKENNDVIVLADRWQRLIISGGDRHGCEPSAALNLTRAQSFSEFVYEIRQERRSHLLFMPQYAEPMCLRTSQTLLDVIRDYPDYAAGSQRWDDRVFHPDHVTHLDRPVSSYWNGPPAFLKRIFSALRLLENTTVHGVLASALRGEVKLADIQDADVLSEVAVGAAL